MKYRYSAIPVALIFWTMSSQTAPAGMVLCETVVQHGTFVGTRSHFGESHQVIGDFPLLAGIPVRISGLDMDALDISQSLVTSDKRLTLQGIRSPDDYLMPNPFTSFSVLQPNFAESTKSTLAFDKEEISSGDVVEFVIDVMNSGSDASSNTRVIDTLPENVTLIPESVLIGYDPADARALYNDLNRRLTVNIGEGASASQGGRIGVEGAGGSILVRFQVTIDESFFGTISNQAIIVAAGEQGSPLVQYSTNSTMIVANQCLSHQDCNPGKPFCDIFNKPMVCVQCVTDLDCLDPQKPDCNAETKVCECFGGQTDCRDGDGDGMSDSKEVSIGTDPDDADSDDDGLLDGWEVHPDSDTDGDGLINALDPDSDNDALYDGTEMGQDCAHADTENSAGHCRADADEGRTTTNPINADTDSGGARDGSEDWSLDGRLDALETDPTRNHAFDDAFVSDSDSDGMGDLLEIFIHSLLNDADTDNDGTLDGEEANPADDTDGDGLINVLDVDSDNDALYDGTESGRECSGAATDSGLGHCLPDMDRGQTITSAVDADTDNGGATDGSEDANLNGIVDNTESDPTSGHSEDDGRIIDSDGDGLGDDLEMYIDSRIDDADSDDDGALDGLEPNPSDDQDLDIINNISDPDSDNDDLFDGLELGFDCDNPATDNTVLNCIADGDQGQTTTCSLCSDTDYGLRLTDGREDIDHDGVVDEDETDPNNPLDDLVGQKCDTDIECGWQSGLVCGADSICIKGCRGEGGNPCPEGLECSSTDDRIGKCLKKGSVDGDAGMQEDASTHPGDGAIVDKKDGSSVDATKDPTNTADGNPIAGGYIQGGGCGCSILGRRYGLLPSTVVFLLLGLSIAYRRRNC